VPLSGCSGDSFGLADNELLLWITDAKFWILLEPREIYGGVVKFELPTKAGKYRLVAELYPANAISNEQKEMLSPRGMRILRGPVAAPVLTVTVK